MTIDPWLYLGLAHRSLNMRLTPSLLMNPAEGFRALQRDYGDVVAFGYGPFRYIGLFGAEAVAPHSATQSERAGRETHIPPDMSHAELSGIPDELRGDHVASVPPRPLTGHWNDGPSGPVPAAAAGELPFAPRRAFRSRSCACTVKATPIVGWVRHDGFVKSEGSGEVVVPDSWVTSRTAVEGFASWCTHRKWLFQPIDGSIDFGKDGYVEISHDGSPTGEMFAVQIKGGASWRSAGGYRIPVGKHRRSWRDSAVPVIGIVDDGGLRWVNLTATLRDDPECSSAFVAEAAQLDASGQSDALLESVRSSTRPGLPMTLGSSSVDDQVGAIWDCFALGRQNPEALVALRRSFLAMDDPASRRAAETLSLCTPHPDVLWTPHNWLPPAIQETVQASMRWSVQEAWRLLALIDSEGGFQRGSFGQCVYMLLVQDPNRLDLARLTAMAAASEDPDVTMWATMLFLHLSGERGPQEWAALLEARPEIAGMPLAAEFTEALRDFGYVSLM